MVAPSPRQSSPRGISALGSGLSFPSASKKVLGALVALLPACVAGLFPVHAGAQTAHFSYVPSGAVSGGLNSPYGVAVDTSGNLYVGDTFQDAVHKYAPNGSGGYTYLADIGSGLTRPVGLAADVNGNIYIADSDNNRVLKETLSGGTYTQSTVASGLSAPHAVAVDANGNVYIADTSNDRVLKETLSGGTYTQSTLASGLTNPNGVAVDASGNVYIADTDTNRVLKETISGGTYTESTVVSSGLSGPWGIAVDASGNLYVSNSLSNLLLKYAPNGSSYTQVDALAVGLATPTGTAVDSNGVAYVVDTSNDRVLKLQTAGVNFNTLAVGSTSGIQSLAFTFDSGGTIGAPVALTTGATGLDFADAGTGTCTTNGTSHTYNANDTCTVDVIFTPKFAGIRRGGIELTTSSGTVIATTPVYGVGTAPQLVFRPQSLGGIGGGFSNPGGLAVDGNSNTYVADTANNAVKKIPAGCTTSGCVTTLGGGFNQPTGITLDGAGSLYITDSGSNAVKQMSSSCASSACVTTLGGGFTTSIGIALDGNGNAYVADSGSASVWRVPAGCLTSSCVTAVGGGFTQPYGVAVDSNGTIYIADAADTVIKTMAPTCASSACVSSLGGGFSNPVGVAVDPAGNIYIADKANNALKQMSAGCASSACVTTRAAFSAPGGVALDDNGNLYVSETGTNLIGKLSRSTPPSLTFVSTNVGNTSSDSPKTVTLENIGNAALTFPVPGTGNNPSISADFLFGGSSTCPLLTTSSSAGTLAAGASCTASISFKPLSSTSISGSLVFTDDALNASPSTTQTIALSGTGTDPVASFTITGLTAATAGTAQTITVTAKDSGGVTYTGYTGTVHFTSSDAQAVLPANYTFTAGDSGVHTFSVTLKTAGSQSVTVTDVVTTSATGTASATISAGAATSYFLDAPGAVPFYTAFSFNAYARDAYGNTDTSYNGTAIMSSSDPGFSNLGPFTFSNGATTVFSAFKTAGNNTLTLTDSVSSSITGTATIYMPPGAVTGLTVSAPASTTAGQAISVTVTARDLFNNTVIGYTGTVSFSSTDTRATLPSSYTFTGGDSGTHTFSATMKTPGNQTITATDTGNSVGGTSSAITVTSPLLVVTVNTDGAANAANCTPQSTSTTGTDGSCRLRDALAQATALGAGAISFDSTAFATAKTINLTSGTLAIPAYTSIHGAVSGSGSSQANLVTVHASSSAIFTVAGSITNSSIVNLITSGGVGGTYAGCLENHGNFAISVSTLTSCSGVDGGAIFNDGTLTLDRDTVSSSSASLRGAGISNAGTLTMTQSTVGGNMAYAGIGTGGGGLYNSGTVTLIGDTISNNSVFSVTPVIPAVAGGIYNSGTVNLANSIVAGNYLIGTGGIAADIFGSGIVDNGGNEAGSSTLPVSLINIKLASLASYGGPVATMVPLPGSPAICGGLIASIPGGTTTDQRGYPRTTGYGGTPCVDSGSTQSSFSLTFAQQPSDVTQNVAMIPAPRVTLTENGNAFTPAVAIPLTLQGTGTLSGSSANTSSGVATYSALKIDTAGTGDKLQAALTLNSTTSTAISATSNAFNVLSSVSQLFFGTSPATPVALGGNAGAAVTVREAASNGSTITTAADTITLTVTGPSSYSQTYSVAAVNGVATFNLSSAALNHAGTYTYTASLSSLQATATQTVNKGTATVTLGSLSATYDGNAHAATATTVPTGLTVSFTYDGSSTAPTAAGSYTVVATVSDADYQGTGNGTLTIGKATAPVALGGLSVTYDGSAHAATATTTPTGLTVNFTYNGSATVPTAAGSYAVVATISDANYQGTSNGTLTIGKATAIVTLSNLSAAYDGSAHAATAATTPSGLTVTLTYNGSSSAPSAAGSYAVVATVNDANYQSSATGTLTIGKVTPTITWAAPAAITYGTPLSATQLNATSGTSGTFAYTPSAGTVLAAGANQQLTVAFTPNDTADYQNATASTTITVNKQGAATALTASATSLSPAQTVTLTATVTPASNGTPSGTVTFLDGSTALQTVTLTGSTASYSTTLASGAHTITATYGGNTNYLGSTSSSGVNISVASLDFTITSTGATSQTVVPGGAVNFTYALTPSSGTYPGPVNFSVSGLPNGATYTLSPNTIAANAGPQQVILAIQTPVSTAGLSMQHRGWALALLLLPFAGMRRMRAGSKKLARTLYILLAVCFCIGMTGCGSGNGFLIQGARDYAVTITASSGTVSHTSTVNLNVQ